MQEVTEREKWRESNTVRRVVLGPPARTGHGTHGETLHHTSAYPFGDAQSSEAVGGVQVQVVLGFVEDFALPFAFGVVWNGEVKMAVLMLPVKPWRPAVNYAN